MSLETDTNSAEKRPASRKGRERRKNIIETAKRRLIKQGHEGLVLREIAVELSITHGNLQYYFKTKEDLLKAIYNEQVREYIDSMKEAAKQASSRNGRIGAIFESTMQVIEAEQTTLWRVLIGIADQNPAFAAILRRENDIYEDALINELTNIAPNMSDSRRGHIAKIMKCILDGMAIELTYSDPRSTEFIAFKGEVRALFQTLIENE